MEKIVVFQDQKIRRTFHKGEWWFSIIDIVEFLSKSNRPRKYWSDLKSKLKDYEDFEVSAKIGQLRLLAPDGKSRETDCANIETLFRIIQSIPSPNANKFKLWLAKVGKERIEEIENPELAQDRVKQYYELKGYPKDWIEKRLRGIAIRQELTDEWKNREVHKETDFAILTNEICKATFGKTVNEYKIFKELKKPNQNLRDHMTDWELIFTMVGEKASADITRTRDAKGFQECKSSAKRGGEIAQNAKKELEQETGEEVVSQKNYLQLTGENKNKKLLKENN